jgi:hypothetical protein
MRCISHQPRVALANASPRSLGCHARHEWGAVEYLLWAAADGQLPGAHVALHVLDGLSAALIDI